MKKNLSFLIQIHFLFISKSNNLLTILERGNIHYMEIKMKIKRRQIVLFWRWQANFYIFSTAWIFFLFLCSKEIYAMSCCIQ